MNLQLMSYIILILENHSEVPAKFKSCKFSYTPADEGRNVL